MIMSLAPFTRRQVIEPPETCRFRVAQFGLSRMLSGNSSNGAGLARQRQAGAVVLFLV